MRVRVCVHVSRCVREGGRGGVRDRRGREAPASSSKVESLLFSFVNCFICICYIYELYR